jgi:hypothetical protein
MVENIVLRKIKNSEELVLDMVSTPDYILKSVDWGSVRGSHLSYKYVNQAGISITKTSLETRDVTIEGWVVARDESHMKVLKKKLNGFVNPQEAIDLFYSDYTIEFVPNESIKYSTDAKENNEVMCKFQIVGTCPNPLFSDNVESRLAFVTTEPQFHFPLIMSESLPEEGIVFGKRTESLIINLVNEGSIPVGMRIVFKAKGTVVNPSLVNVKTQEKFTIIKTLVANEEVEVNTNIGEKRVRGRVGNNDYVNYFMYKDIDSPWLQLEVGDNIFRYDAEEGIDSLDVFAYFRNRYLEVQECY